MADEIQLTPEQLEILLQQNQPRDTNREDWESDDDSSSSGNTGGSSTNSSGSSGAGGPRRPKSPIYVPPNKRTTTTEPAFENEKGNPEDKHGKPVGARPGQPGSTYRVQNLPYILTDAQFRYLKKRFPRTLFRANDDQNHDHPIAHTETLVATRHMQQKYNKDIKILDVYGNPTSNEYYNKRQTTGNDNTGRTMESLVHRFTEKDYLRAVTKWGPRIGVDDQGDQVERYKDFDLKDIGNRAADNQWVAGFDHYQFIHTLYYMDMSLLAAMLSSGEEGDKKYKSFSAVIHKHSAHEGKMFGGEVTYKKQFGVVRQTNRETGESYVHQDLSFLFESKSKVWRDSQHAFTWTFHKVTDETWVVWGAGCPNDLDERFVSYARSSDRAQAAHRLNQESLLDNEQWVPTKYTMPGGRSRMIGGRLVIQPAGSDVELVVSNYEFVDYLRQQVAGKPRDMEQFAALMAIARREVESGSRFPGSHSFDVPVDEFTHHVVLAFYMDTNKEIASLGVLQLQAEALRKHRSMSGGFAAYDFTGSSGLARSAISAARVVHSVAKSNDSFGAILSELENVNHNK